MALISDRFRYSSVPLPQEAYIWQRIWTPAVDQSVQQAGPLFSGWRVLVSQSDTAGNWKVFVPNLAELNKTHTPLTAVFRIDGQHELDRPREIEQKIAQWAATASIAGWTGVEIDYDCPTRSLPAYAAFLSDLHHQLPAGIRLSITALPAWLHSEELGMVLNVVDQSVLQVHSVLDPRHGLFDGDQARNWIADYARISTKPFAVALPDYGSKVAWDAQGQIAAITSENQNLDDWNDSQELEAPPDQVESVLSRLLQRHPVNLVAVIWFRLPVAGDRRIWNLSTLQAVIQQQPLQTKLVTRINKDAAGAYQLALVNVGMVDMPVPQTVALNQLCQAADAIGAYQVEHTADSVLFHRRNAYLLQSGQQLAIGWTRCPLSSAEIRLEN